MLSGACCTRQRHALVVQNDIYVLLAVSLIVYPMDIPLSNCNLKQLIMVGEINKETVTSIILNINEVVENSIAFTNQT